MSVWPAYYDKPANLRSRPERRKFWDMILRTTEPKAVLEVGCGDGLNLEHIKAATVVGVDSYAPAIGLARARLGPLADLRVLDIRKLVHVPGYSTPGDFLPGSFDLAFTCTVLQHIPNDVECLAALTELIVVSSKWVLVMEYAADVRTPVLWRGDPEGIVKRPWRELMEFEGLEIQGTGLLRREDGFDDVSWYLAKQ